MDLTDKDINTFIDAWKKDFGEQLAPEQARADMHRLLDFFVTLNEVLKRASDVDEVPVIVDNERA
jgi:hypothetical protein